MKIQTHTYVTKTYSVPFRIIKIENLYISPQVNLNTFAKKAKQTFTCCNHENEQELHSIEKQNYFAYYKTELFVLDSYIAGLLDPT